MNQKGFYFCPASSVLVDMTCVKKIKFEHELLFLVFINLVKKL